MSPVTSKQVGTLEESLVKGKIGPSPQIGSCLPSKPDSVPAPLVLCFKESAMEFLRNRKTMKKHEPTPFVLVLSNLNQLSAATMIVHDVNFWPPDL